MPSESQYCIRLGNGVEPPVVLLDGSEPSLFSAHLQVLDNVSFNVLLRIEFFIVFLSLNIMIPLSFRRFYCFLSLEGTVAGSNI